MHPASPTTRRPFDWVARQRRRETLLSFFTHEEISRLESARARVNAAQATIAYCVYENPFARSGGVYAVADNSCGWLSRHGRSVVAISPLHARLRTAPREADLRSIGYCHVPFAGRSVPVTLLEHVRGGVRWVLPHSENFFLAEGGSSGTDPYLYGNPGQLLSDSLFFCAALPHVLAALGLRDNVIGHLQDWETASAALTLKAALLDGVLGSAAVVLTSHNPYDQGLPWHALQSISHRSYQGLERLHTVYQYMLPLTDAPITTVSRTFAEELCHDPLQCEVFADHLQGVFRRHGLIGVDNGLFGEMQPPYPTREVRAAETGDPAGILQRKLQKRRAMLTALAAYRDDRIVGHLDGGEGAPLTGLADNVPVFLMFGRLDPAQKGFDVLCRAIEALPRGRTRWIFTPIVSSAAPRAFFDDLAELAADRPGEVVVYPFRMEQGYREAMAGASYAVMPSLYEPFGGATEPYLAGTPVVARATGGLVQQVTDIDVDPQSGTGIVYREHGDAAGWRAVQAAITPAQRMTVPIYGAMVASLAAALTRAADIYRAEPVHYGRMLAAGYSRAEQFSWERTAAEYQKVYEMATEG